MTMYNTKPVVCEKCLGKGYVNGGDENSTWSKSCEDCHGIGFVRVPMTNFDRILSMDYEKFAEFIMLSPEMEFGVCECCEVFRGHGAYTPCGTEDGWCTAELRCNAFKKWLQQPAEEIPDGN